MNFFSKKARAEKKSASRQKDLARLIKSDHTNADGEITESWVERAIANVVERTAKNFKVLEKSLVEGQQNTPCCIVNKESERKPGVEEGPTHVITCVLFRFPFVKQPKQLMSVPGCEEPYRKKAAQYCVNPFHYEIKPPPRIPGICLEPGRFEWTSFHDRPHEQLEVLNRSLPTDASSYNNRRPGVVTKRPFEYDEEQKHYDRVIYGRYIAAVPGEREERKCSRDAAMSAIDKEERNTAASMSPLRGASDDMEVDESDEEEEEEPRHDPLDPIAVPESIRTGAPQEVVAYQESPIWISLKYYEKDTSVGEPLNASENHILIDMSPLPPKPGRLNLGYLKNARRTPDVEKARSLIGKGVRIYYLGGEVYMENLSANNVYLQSGSFNSKFGYPPATVVKVPPRCNVKIWNNAEFAEELARCANTSYDAVYDLIYSCKFRVSLVKGWGKQYSRQTVTSTPCWLEGHLTNANVWIDNIITKMGVPHHMIGSYS